MASTMKRLLHLLAIACMFAPPLQAQRVLVSGKVMDAQTKESLQGANVYLRKLNKGVVSDERGNFQLSLSSSPKVEMNVSYVGYQTQKLHLNLTNDTVLTIKLIQDNRLAEVNVYADSQLSGIETSQMSAIEVPIEEVKKLPMLFGEVDVMKAMQKLPGVLRHGYVLLIVCLSFVLFNADSLSQALSDMGGMFGLAGVPLVNAESLYYLRSYAPLFVMGFVGATPIVRDTARRIGEKSYGVVLETLLMAVLLIVCSAYLVDGSFSPFLYFRF